MKTKQVETFTKVELKSKSTIVEASTELRSLQRHRSIVLKFRNMLANRLQAIVAGDLGYHSGMAEKERAAKFVEASALIKAVDEGTSDSSLKPIIKAAMISMEAFESMKSNLEIQMRQAAKKLPVLTWVTKPEQRGFGALFLAIVIGETGDLANYANPAKVWKRLGCAPHTFDGKTLMGATWKSGKHGKLPAEEWEAFGYSPRRRSIAYLIGEGLMKQNKSKYRKRYEESKVLFKQSHPDYCDQRCHRHAMLLACKLLLKNLWLEWNNYPKPI